jgi:hypothetical protein
VYLLNRYAVQRRVPTVPKGGPDTFNFHVFADSYTLFAAGQRVRIPDQHDWLCNNRYTIR